MRIALLFVVISLLQFSHCNDSESNEINQIEISPFYDTIIFSDVVDIINEVNKNLKSPLNTFDDSESESDENIEDLLSEYQHYLDKAHEQRRIYLEKVNKTKNKIPPLRHENFVKTSIPTEEKFKKFYSHSFFSPNVLKMPPTAYNRALDLFVPFNSAIRYINKPEASFASQSNDFKEESLRTHNKIELERKKPLNLSLVVSKTINKPINSPCFCKPGQLPYNCRQCLIPKKSIMPSDKQLEFLSNGSDKKGFPQSPFIFEPESLQNMLEVNNKANTLNVRIKVDLQLPQIQDGTGKLEKINNSADVLEDNSKEFTSNIRLPTTYFNFPIPMDVFGFKIPQSNKRNSNPMHKIMIHKKKKSRSGSNNKRHRKKLITFHNINLSSSHTLNPKPAEKPHTSTEKKNYTDSTLHINEAPNKTTVKMALVNITTISTELPVIVNTTQIEESIYFMVNISNNSENETDDGHKTGNSIEFDYKTVFLNNTETTPNLRKKRDTILQNQTATLNVTSKNSDIKIKSNKQNVSKKSNRSVLSDTELLYWPSYSNNLTAAKVRNLTEIILDRENKKAKLNMTNEAIRQDRTMALEQAIFGEVDWNDVDTVAPPLISFVGKYINGALTLCSEKKCHSMKCMQKTCVHRICIPEERFNHVAHCYGSNKTDSIVSMESIMDLPSNVAFEIVDILQRKMPGKMFGKVTLCISSKCISFVTSKKTFIKSKCVTKDLNKAGHCPNIKKS